ncbi:MAG: serine hydrolase [Bryobacteraceae bacterium]|nr:serine hydrolase [Bryobacteraceae bacterium]
MLCRDPAHSDRGIRRYTPRGAAKILQTHHTRLWKRQGVIHLMGFSSTPIITTWSKLAHLCFFFIILPCLAQPPAVYDWSKLDEILSTSIGDERSTTANLFSGLTLMIAAGDQVVYAKGLGDQTVDTVLPIASSTKMPSGLVIMKLVELGLLDLDRPVGEYLKADPTFVWGPDKSAITTRMLFNHTSGLSVDAPCLNDQRSATLRDCAQVIARQSLEFSPPGSRFAYSGSSMQVAGYVAELVSGKKWNDLFAEYVGRPLDLRRFTYGATDNPRIAGGASSDTGDYLKITRMLLAGGVWEGKRLFSPGVWELFRSNQVAGVPKLPGRSPGRETLTGYSFGWWHSDPSYLSLQPVPRTSGPELSDQGAFGSTPWMDLGLNYAAVLLVNKRTQAATELWDRIRPVIVEQIQKNRGASVCVRAPDSRAGLLAPSSIVSVFGQGLAESTVTAPSTTLPTELGGVLLRVRDSAGVETPARLYYVSPNQINFVAPESMSPGNTLVFASRGGSVSPLCAFAVASGIATLFSADGSGTGWAAALITRVLPDGSQIQQPTIRAATIGTGLEAIPIDLTGGEQVFLSIFGSGLPETVNGVTVRIGTLTLSPLYAGRQGQYPGLSQINLQLPTSLRGIGEVDLKLTLNGFESNTVKLLFR